MVSRATSVPEEDRDTYDIVAPRPDVLVESLRAFGYSPQAALADLVDNSIAAGAHTVDITFTWDGADSWIKVCDDGSGMTPDELVAAMRPGSQSPLLVRDQRDLGRFGLGLKTASFSQCRRLTVQSVKRGGVVAATRRWDLDYISATSEWRLLHGSAPGSEQRLDAASDRGGTQVLWERLDRLVGDVRVGDQKAERHYLDIVSEIEDHLAMVFHRYMSKRGGVALRINGHRIAPWDPFLLDESATQWLAEESLPLGTESVRVRPFVLPHHAKIDPSTHRSAAGRRGWNGQQGFYVYRHERLLVAGSWLGLGFQQEEHCKLARIAIDLPNSLEMDHAWDIDVRKSRARPPGALRENLRRIARVTRERAVAVYRYRGKSLARRAAGDQTFIWSQHLRNGKVSYTINRDHPLVADALHIPTPYRSSVRALLRLVEETLPVPMILLDGAERPGQQADPFDDMPTPEILRVMTQIYRVLRHGGLSPQQARERLTTMEPFDRFLDLVTSLDDQIDAMEDNE
jgi:hypothetical protein